VWVIQREDLLCSELQVTHTCCLNFLNAKILFYDKDFHHVILTELIITDDTVCTDAPTLRP